MGSDVGKREVIFKGKSNLSGDYIVEEVTSQDNKILRRLIFLSNQFAIQSEALIKTGRFSIIMKFTKSAGYHVNECAILTVKDKSNKRVKKIIEPSYLACQHHLYMTVGINVALKPKKRTTGQVAIIGLGGGGLCTFIRQVLR